MIWFQTIIQILLYCIPISLYHLSNHAKKFLPLKMVLQQQKLNNNVTLVS